MCNCEEQNPKEITGRRNFFMKISLAMGAFIGAVLAFPLITAMLDPVLRKRKKVWRVVGNLSEFNVDETKLVTFENTSPYQWGKKISDSAAYVRLRKDGSFLALSVNCAHLGCPVKWVQKSEMFFCPCHGGVFYKDGSWAAGPPPRGMFSYPIRVNDEKVEIETDGVPLTGLTA